MLFRGEVVGGQKIGRTINFPTANIAVDGEIELPSIGVYAARVVVEAQSYNAMAYIGRRPTVEQSEQPVIEANILDFSGDIYGQTIEIELLEFIRGEQKFDSLEQLRQQIERDRERIIEILK